MTDINIINNHPRLLTQSIGDAEIEYLVYDGPGRTLILLHATGFPPWLWHPIAKELSQFYLIIAPFFCDHRDPDTSNGAVSWLTLARDLKHFCRNLEMDKPFVVGHSMGATVAAISQAVCGLDDGGMILIEPIILIEDFYRIPFTVQDHPFASKSIKRINYWRDELELRQYFESKSLFSIWDGDVVELYIRYGFQKGPSGEIQLVCSPHKEAALFMGGMKYNPWPILPKILCPVLILEGVTSENRIYTELEKASSLMPQGTYALIQGVGHLMPMERPQKVTQIIMNYLQEVNY
jgi:lipase